MSAGTAAIRVIGLAGQLRSRKAPAAVTKILRVEEPDRTVERGAERPKNQGYLCPEWWESHHYERR
jgi:hypothetical protein